MDLDEKLRFFYNLIMEPGRRGLFNARAIRAGYSHWLGREVKTEVRMFSGMVSEKAMAHGEKVGLVLEHPYRIQKSLTALIQRHMIEGEDPEDFVKAVKELEIVNIVVKKENDILRRNEIDGDYSKAGIKLIPWSEIEEADKGHLKKKLRGQVANYSDFIK